jgi:HEAT repeat protein
LRSLQWVRLYEDWNDGIARILSVVRPDDAELRRLSASLVFAPSYSEGSTTPHALAQLGAAGIPALLEATTSRAYGVAHCASEALAEISAPDAVSLLVDALGVALGNSADCQVKGDELGREMHSGPHVAEHICQALGRVNDPSAISALSEAEFSQCRRTRESASEALAMIRRASGG